MAVIDLGSGKMVQEAPTVASQIGPQVDTEVAVSKPGRIIDLNTGKFTSTGPTSMPGQPGQVDISPFPEQREETRAAQELPEFGSAGLLGGEDKLKIAALTPVFLATTDAQEIGNILAKNFPNIGISTDPGGNQLARNNETGVEVIINAPGISKLDVLQGLGVMAAFTPAGRGAAIPTQLAGKVAAGAAGAGLTQAAIEGVQSQVGGEFDKSEVGTAAALGGAAELVVPAIQAARQSRQAGKVGAQAADIEAVAQAIKPAQEAVEKVTEATGKKVGLFPAQQTELPSEVIKQRLLPQLDAGAKKAAQALERQNKEAFDATSELINTIAPAKAAETGSKRFRTAAQNAIQAAKDSRSQGAKALYKEALDEGASVDVKPIQDMIEESLKDAPEGGEIVRVMDKIQKFIAPRKSEAGPIAPTLRQLQKTKFELDNMLEKFGDNALGNTTKREVVQLKRALVEQMEEASPLYKEANEAFAKGSPAIKELEDSIVGAVAGMKDVNLQNVSKRIFSANSNPDTVRNAKKIIDRVDPGAWDDMLRVEFQRRFGGIETLAEDIPGELVGNVPGQLRRAIFGNPEQRRTLLSALSPDQRKNFVYLEEVLRRASTGRQAGSPTVPFGEALDKIKGTAGVLRDVIFRPLKTLQETGERGLFDRKVAALTDAMFDPNFKPQMAKLRKLNPDSPAAARAMAQLLNQPEQDEK